MISCRGSDRSQHIGHVRERHQSRGLLQQGPVGIQIQQPIVRNRDEFKPHTFFGGQHVPGHQIAVMLHLRQDDQLTGLDVGTRPGVGDEVDRPRWCCG